MTVERGPDISKVRCITQMCCQLSATLSLTAVTRLGEWRVGRFTFLESAQLSKEQLKSCWLLG